MILEHTSHSQIEMWLRCPRQWYYRYVEGLRVPPSGALVLGGSYHKALEINFTYKLSSGMDLPLDDTLDAFSLAWEERVVEEVVWEGQDPGALKDMGYGLVELYHTEVAPRVIPVAVEAPYNKPLAGTKFVTVIDLVDENASVIDHKTSSQAYNQDDVDKNLQPSAHAFAVGNPLDYEYHVAVKTKVPKIQIMKTTRTVDDILWWLDLARGVVEQMRSGIAPPNPNGWHCSPKFCGYWSMCRPSRWR